jgi:hypothetical protein
MSIVAGRIACVELPTADRPEMCCRAPRHATRDVLLSWLDIGPAMLRMHQPVLGRIHSHLDATGARDVDP